MCSAMPQQFWEIVCTAKWVVFEPRFLMNVYFHSQFYVCLLRLLYLVSGMHFYFFWVTFSRSFRCNHLIPRTTPNGTMTFFLTSLLHYFGAYDCVYWSILPQREKDALSWDSEVKDTTNTSLSEHKVQIETAEIQWKVPCQREMMLLSDKVRKETSELMKGTD